MNTFVDGAQQAPVAVSRKKETFWRGNQRDTKSKRTLTPTSLSVCAPYDAHPRFAEFCGGSEYLIYQVDTKVRYHAETDAQAEIYKKKKKNSCLSESKGFQEN